MKIKNQFLIQAQSVEFENIAHFEMQLTWLKKNRSIKDNVKHLCWANQFQYELIDLTIVIWV
jgi:hypothetical protein